MRSVTALLGALGISLAGCLEQSNLHLEGVTEGASAVVWTDAGEGWAFEVEAEPPTLAWPTSGALHLATFPWTLGQLGLERGPLPKNIDELGAVPTPTEIFEVVRAADGWRTTPASNPDAALSALRWPKLDDAACLLSRGCRPPDGSAICLAPCPDPDAPAPPAPPNTPCPAGWAELDDIVPAPLRWCEPVRAPSDLDCAPGEGPWYDLRDCGPIDECPGGDFREVDGDAVYVRAGATGGDGSAQSPFGTLQSALRSAPEGTLVLGPGTYRLDAIESAARIVGRCTASTTLVSTLGASRTISLAGAGARLEHLTVRAGVVATASASIAHVYVPEGGLRAVGAALTARRAFVEAGRHDVQAEQGGRLRLEDVSVQGGAALGCQGPGARLEILRTWARGGTGAALLATSCEAVEAEGVILEGSSVGVRLAEGVGRLAVRDAWVRDVRGQAFVLIRDGAPASLPATVVRLERISVVNAGYVVEARGGYDLTMRDVFATDVRAFVMRIETSEGAPFDIDAARIWARETGGLLSGKRSERALAAPPLWALEDAVIVQSHPAGISPALEGMVRLSDGARLAARRLYLGAGKRLGLVAWESQFLLEDITVQGALYGFELRAERDSEGARLAALDIPGTGFKVLTSVANGGRVVLQDVQSTADDAQALMAIGLESSTRFGLDVERLEVCGAPLAVFATGDTRISQARLTDCEVGLHLVDGADLADFSAGLAVECPSLVQP